MDKQILVKEFKEVVLAFKKEGKHVACADFIPAYTELNDSPLIFAVVCPWMKNYNSCFQKTREVVDAVYRTVSKESLGHIYSIMVFDDEKSLRSYFDQDGFPLFCEALLSPTLEEAFA